MSAYGTVLLWALLPAAGNFLGGALAEMMDVSQRTLSLALGVLLALGQVPADIPEVFATIAAFKDKGLARARRLLLAASFTILFLLGATLGFFAVRNAPEIVKISLLTFTAGILALVAVEEMIPEAPERGEPKLGLLALVFGFALFALISVHFEA